MPASDISAPQFAFLMGGGKLAALIAAFDWSVTPLGPIAGWQHCLKTTVSIVLRSQVPIVLLWGSDGIMIYNDAYAEFASDRHPFLLGSKVRDGWPEVASFNDHVMQTCMRGDTLAYRDQELTLHRSGSPEQVWMNLDYSPVLNDAGKPVGVMAIVIETTEKVMSERWRSSERDRQRQMFEQAPGFMAMLSGPEHTFELTNASYMQLVGHRDVLGHTVREALPEVDGQGFLELLDEVYRTGERFVGSSLKAQIQRTPNAPIEDRFIDFVYQPVRNPTGDVIGIFVQGDDVTERLVAEASLRKSEAQFRTFAEAMPNQVWTSTPDGGLNWFNPRVYEYSGASPGDLDGDGWAVIIHPDDVARVAEVWQNALISGVFYETEFRVRRHDGAYRWYIARSVPIRDAEGTITQWIGTNTDIHDQKAVSQKLAESERRLQLSQGVAGISSLELDIATGNVFGSEGFWDLWGLSPRESVHISVLEEIVVPEDGKIRSTVETSKDGTAVPNAEYRILHPATGKIRWLSRHIDFVHDEAGKPTKMYGVMQDITARKEAETRQLMLTHELEHRIKNILSMVSAIASQTFRNTDIETGRTVFADRLRALANAHDILNDTRWTDASMLEVVTNTIAIFPPDQITISGPPVSLSPKMALSLALAVNELGTNALKYGALSTPSGAVSVDWSLIAQGDAAGETLVWHWIETGGPLVTPPSRRGFGTVLVENVLANDFEGLVKITYHPAGVECVLTAPMTKLN
jgi:PAS domain S-box-containing protein